MRLLLLWVFGGWGWMVRLGGLGLILLGLVDNSFIPIPGSIDLLTIVLSAHRREWWWYYAVMATAGSLAGAYLTFRLGWKGGEETLQKKVPASEVERVYRIFRKYGFLAIFVPALLPPPVPIVPFVLTAGILKYSRRKFALALGSARLIRYSLVAYLGSRYGGGIFAWATRYYRPMLVLLIVLGLAGGGVVLWYVKKRKRVRRQQRLHDQPARKSA